MASEQMQNTKNSAAETAGQTKQFGQKKTGQAQQHAEGLGQSAQDKAGQAKEVGQEKTGRRRGKPMSKPRDSGRPPRRRPGRVFRALHKLPKTRPSKQRTKPEVSSSRLENKVTETFNNVKGSVMGNQ